MRLPIFAVLLASIAQAAVPPRITPTRAIGKTTYRAATATAANGVVVTAASAAPFACIYGSATKTVILHRAILSGPTLTAVAYNSFVAAKYSTVFTGGSATALAMTPVDSTSPAATATNVSVFTAAPVAGTLVGTLDSQRVLLQATTAAAAGVPPTVVFDRALGGDTTGVYLRGVTQGVCINFGAAPATAVTLSVAFEWTEQSTTTEP